MPTNPQEGEIVFVQGGVAQYRNGVFYTGMEDPRWTRPIQWEVTWWASITQNPITKQDELWEMAELHDGAWSLRFQGQEVAVLPLGFTESGAQVLTRALNKHEASKPMGETIWYSSELKWKVPE